MPIFNIDLSEKNETLTGENKILRILYLKFRKFKKIQKLSSRNQETPKKNFRKEDIQSPSNG